MESRFHFGIAGNIPGRMHFANTYSCANRHTTASLHHPCPSHRDAIAYNHRYIRPHRESFSARLETFRGKGI